MAEMPVDSDHSYTARAFDGLDCSGAMIARSTFEDCAFRNCRFDEATFERCRFAECTFVECNLSLMRVPGTRFSDVVFEDCKLVGVDWTRADWPRIALRAPLAFRSCILTDTSFHGLQLPELVMEHCRAHEVDFRDGNFARARFCFSELTGSLFNRTDLSGADFTDATDYEIDLTANRVEDAVFSSLEAVRLLRHLGIRLVD
ncbi:MAG: pentapeptide repeat-containing protein [Pseudomonadales bacterium]|nr:pentapeptide repeat-containing protein [Pseudomonadales bacterium]